MVLTNRQRPAAARRLLGDAQEVLGDQTGSSLYPLEAGEGIDVDDHRSVGSGNHIYTVNLQVQHPAHPL